MAIPDPTFGEYPRCLPHAATYTIHSPLTRAVERRPRRRPDRGLTPTILPGLTYPRRSLYDVAARTPDTTFLVDESFLVFSGQPSLIRLLEAEPLDNIVILTSLGKGLGVPGLRLGYLYTSNAELRQQFQDFMPIWGVNALAEYFLELTIKFRTDLETSVAYMAAERARMRRLLEEQPSCARCTTAGATSFSSELAGRGSRHRSRLRRDLLAHSRIEVKDVSGKYPDRLPRLRLAVRTQEETTGC